MTMVELMDLWLPILLSAVIVFVASSIIWMATPLHKHDVKNAADSEDTILDTLRATNLSPGVYFLPWCAPNEAKDPERIKRMEAGPWAMLTVRGSKPSMGPMLGLWFVHAIIVSVIVAYIAANAGLAPGAAYMSVFRIVGMSTLLAHAGYALPMAIWHGMPWSQVPGKLIDGIVYALLTAGTFAWLWPDSIVVT